MNLFKTNRKLVALMKRLALSEYDFENIRGKKLDYHPQSTSRYSLTPREIKDGKCRKSHYTNHCKEA